MTQNKAVSFQGILIVSLLFGISASINAQGKKPPAESQKKGNAAEVTPPKPTAMPLQNPSEQAVNSPEIKKLSLEETKKLYDEGKAVFIDGRSPSSYQVRHIKGSVNCSLGEFDIKVVELKNRLAPETPLVVYCGGETCGLAEKVGKKLMEQGFKNVTVFAPGWPAWAGANYPSEP